MTTERDTDRELRAWVAEGVDRAPERFVWAALDEVEQLPQRRPWRARLDVLGNRLRPATAGVAVAVAAVIAVAVVLRVAGPDFGSQGPGRFTVADLQEILVWDHTMPATWTLDNLVSNPWEVIRIPIRSMNAAELDAFQEPRGYIGGRYTSFSGPDAIFMSWGTVFETPRDAAAALTFMQSEMESPDAWGLERGEPLTFADEGFVYSGETTALLGPPTGVDPHPGTIYLWREGNALLAVGGWFNFDAAELRSVAEGMNARADAIGRDR